MHVRVVRRGGFAGIPLSGELETDELPPEQARLALAALAELPVEKHTPPPHPDGFQYEIAFAPADGAARSLVLNEGDVSDALRPVIATAMGRGTLG